MSRDDNAVGGLGQLSFRTAGELRLLCERMQALSFKPDNYELADIEHLADALHGMAMRCAMSTGNTTLLNEFAGRTFRQLHGDHLYGSTGAGNE